MCVRAFHYCPLYCMRCIPSLPVSAHDVCSALTRFCSLSVHILAVPFPLYYLLCRVATSPTPQPSPQAVHLYTPISVVSARLLPLGPLRCRFLRGAISHPPRNEPILGFASLSSLVSLWRLLPPPLSRSRFCIRIHSPSSAQSCHREAVPDCSVTAKAHVNLPPSPRHPHPHPHPHSHSGRTTW